mmetsp:Transcript_32396/g.89539  ORF Transcript_32396/g.89539 Transcript_32396/m.89539 type:complete len:211 (+) Transcript_32396:954-1586(+)
MRYGNQTGKPKAKSSMARPNAREAAPRCSAAGRPAALARSVAASHTRTNCSRSLGVNCGSESSPSSAARRSSLPCLRRHGAAPPSDGWRDNCRAAAAERHDRELPAAGLCRINVGASVASLLESGSGAGVAATAVVLGSSAARALGASSATDNTETGDFDVASPLANLGPPCALRCGNLSPSNDPGLAAGASWDGKRALSAANSAQSCRC